MRTFPEQKLQTVFQLIPKKFLTNEIIMVGEYKQTIIMPAWLYEDILRQHLNIRTPETWPACNVTDTFLERKIIPMIDSLNEEHDFIFYQSQDLGIDPYNPLDNTIKAEGFNYAKCT